MAKKITFFIIIVVVLGAAAWWGLQKNEAPATSSGPSDPVTQSPTNQPSQVDTSRTQSPPPKPSAPVAPPQSISYKTYTNMKFGFQFDYPSDWQIAERGDRISWPGSGFSIERSSSDQEPGVVQWFSDNHLSYDVSVVTIAGLQGKKLVGKWGMALKPYDLVTFNRGGVFYLVELPPTYSKVFLDSFKFIQ